MDLFLHIPIPEPLPCKGALSLWNVPRNIESRVKKEINVEVGRCADKSERPKRHRLLYDAEQRASL